LNATGLDKTTTQPKKMLTLHRTSFAPEEQTHAVHTYYFICYPVLALFLGGSDTAIFIQRIHYWLQNAKSGYRLLDGSKWIFNGYKEWQEQMPWLSVGQIGRIVRDLEQRGWLISDHFYNLKRSVGFAQRTPAFQEDNQRKWYRIDYVKILSDTGFDLLFEGVDKSAPPEPMAETLENNQSSNLNNAMFKFEDSSIYKDNTKLTQESENSSIEIDKKPEMKHVVEVNEDPPCPKEEKGGWQESNTDYRQDNCSAAPLNKTSKKVKQDLIMFSPESLERPARQNPKLRYPAGPWLTSNGCLNEDFVRDRALLWRTGDTVKSQAFGKMPIEETMALVCSYYTKLDNHANLEIHWAAYVAKNQRYFENVKQRIDVGINLPIQEQQQALAKLPGVLSEKVESVYESATIHPEMLLGSGSLELPRLTTSTVLLPDDGENCQIYQNNLRPEDVEWMKRFESVQPKTKKPQPTSAELEAAKAAISALKAKRDEEKARARERKLEQQR
jgi:hypothetical protein